MVCIFTEKDNKIQIGIRKVSIQKRPSKKSPDRVSKIFYLPIHKDEALRLGLREDSILKAEISVLPRVETKRDGETDD
jgi:hypothetical protein